MKFNTKIKAEKMIHIRYKVIDFHLEMNRKVMILLKIIMILGAVIALTTSITIQSIVFAVLVIYANILILKSTQRYLARRRIARFYKKNNIEQVVIKYDIEENIVTNIKYNDITKRNEILIKDISAFQVDVNDELIIYTTGKFITNLTKSKPRYIYMDELNKDEKNKLITLFRDTNKKEIFK
jgi:membrane protein implicated in regulation of membrane protease activity